MHGIQISRTLSIFILSAALLIFPQVAELKPLKPDAESKIRIKSAHVSFNGEHIQPQYAKQVVAHLCNGNSICHEQIKASDFYTEGALTSLTVIYSCRGLDGFFEFDLDNESGRNEGDYLRLNCYRAGFDDDAELGSTNSLVAKFAVDVASHLAGVALEQLLFPSGIDQEALAETIKVVVKQVLDTEFLDEHQSTLNGQLLILAGEDQAIRDAVGQDNWDATVAESLQFMTGSSFIADLTDTEQALRSDTLKDDIRGSAFPSYISAASALIGTFEFQQELENYSGSGVTKHVTNLAQRLGDKDHTPIIPFVLDTKGDMIFEDLASTRPECYRVRDTEWGFQDCNGKVHRSSGAEWNYDACYVNTWSSYQSCAQQEYPIALATDAMGWIDSMVEGWREALINSQAQLPASELPCDYCADAFNTITTDVFLLGWHDANNNSNSSQMPTVFIEARCNGLNTCDAYYTNEDLPGYNPGENKSSQKTHISASDVIYHCAGDEPGTSRSYIGIAGTDFDSKGTWVHLDCTAPALCTNPSTCTD